MEKKLIIMKKKFVQKKLNFGLLPKYIARLKKLYYSLRFRNCIAEREI